MSDVAATGLRPPPTFMTMRLVASIPQAGDAPEALRVYAGDPAATRYLLWQPYARPEPLAEFYAGQARTWRAAAASGEAAGAFAWLLRERGGGALVGSIGLVLEPRKASAGYVFGPAYWGRGYATEALRWVVGWALAQPELQRVWAFCHAEHAASARVMEKAGLQREAHLRRWQVFPNLGPDLQDCLVHAAVK